MDDYKDLMVLFFCFIFLLCFGIILVLADLANGI